MNNEQTSPDLQYKERYDYYKTKIKTMQQKQVEKHKSSASNAHKLIDSLQKYSPQKTSFLNSQKQLNLETESFQTKQKRFLVKNRLIDNLRKQSESPLPLSPRMNSFKTIQIHQNIEELTAIETQLKSQKSTKAEILANICEIQKQKNEIIKELKDREKEQVEKIEELKTENEKLKFEMNEIKIKMAHEMEQRKIIETKISQKTNEFKNEMRVNEKTIACLKNNIQILETEKTTMSEIIKNFITKKPEIILKTKS